MRTAPGGISHGQVRPYRCNLPMQKRPTSIFSPPQAPIFGAPKRFQWFLTLVVNFRAFRSGATPSLTQPHTSPWRL